LIISTGASRGAEGQRGGRDPVGKLRLTRGDDAKQPNYIGKGYTITRRKAIGGSGSGIKGRIFAQKCEGPE